jgi:hypothetical protein
MLFINRPVRYLLSRMSVTHIIQSMDKESVRLEAERTVSLILVLPRASGLSSVIGHFMKNLAAW